MGERLRTSEWTFKAAESQSTSLQLAHIIRGGNILKRLSFCNRLISNSQNLLSGGVEADGWVVPVNSRCFAAVRRPRLCPHDSAALDKEHVFGPDLVSGGL